MELHRFSLTDETKNVVNTNDASDFDAIVADILQGEPFLPSEVRTAQLEKYPQHQLESRLTYYEREYTFERSPKIRLENKRELLRTRLELKRRQFLAQQQAIDQVFKIPERDL